MAGVATSAGFSGFAQAASVKDLPTPSKWDMTTDVLVAGSGIAGMSAAVTAIDLGAKVLVCEKGQNYGGCAIINGGIIALRGGTRFQKENGEEDSPEALYAHLTDPKNIEYRKNDPKLVRRYSEMCGPTQVWLEEHGVKFLNTSTKKGKYDSQHKESYLHIYSPDRGDGNGPKQLKGGYRTGRGIMIPFKNHFESKGGKILLEHKVTDVYKDKTGRVIGARVGTPSGVVNIRALKGVVLAGGGWKANTELRTITDPRFTPDMPATGYPFVAPDGSAILAGLKAGGMYLGDRGEDTAHMRRMFGTNRYGFPKGSKYGCPGIGVKGPRWADVIFVNKNGDRFVREEDKSDLGGYNFYDMAYAQPEKKIWCIFDDDAARKNHWDTSYPTCEKGFAFDANTIEELGRKLGTPKLAETVARFNKFCENKKDLDFDRPEDMLRPIQKGPFHAVQVVLFVHNLTGGLRINENAQVLDIMGKPIAGLYAAGETAGGLYVGNGMPRGIMPGRFAGEHVARS